MNNEEKILEMLEKLNGKVDAMDQRLTERLDRLEDRVGVIDERSQRTAVLLETEITQKLNLLYEGHDSIMEYLDKLATKSRVEILEGDVALLKDVIRLMQQDIAALKKAQ